MEAYLKSNLTTYLMWYYLLSRSELHNPMVKVRYGLLMEAYLKSNQDHLRVIYRQFEALNKLHAASELVKAVKGSPKDEVNVADLITFGSLPMAPEKERIFISIVHISSPNPMFDHLLELSYREWT